MSHPNPLFDPADHYDEIVTICPYCGTQTSAPCCGENHHERHYAKSVRIKPQPINEITKHWLPRDFLTYEPVNPITGEILDDWCDESRVED